MEEDRTTAIGEVKISGEWEDAARECVCCVVVKKEEEEGGNRGTKNLT